MGSLLGKTVAQRTYLHISGIPNSDATLQSHLSEAERLAGIERFVHYNVIRYEPTTGRIALLHYPEFFDQPFPALRESWLVDLMTGELSYRTYEDSLNPPILHRKELLLPDNHPRRAEYAALTEAATTIGLFDEPTRIGYQRQWQQRLREKGYQIIGHDLVPLGNDESSHTETTRLPNDWLAARQLTALVRYGFSAPLQLLARYGFLEGQYTIFDYGCGRGDDVRGLVEKGLQAAGWDPYYAPENVRTRADIVNLGFVINVIEDFEERVEALTQAFSLAGQLLVVSVMLVNQNNAQGQRFGDGLLTQRGTFQKYYTQAEIKAFLKAVLDEEPIPVTPGILFIFRDKDAEQRFLLNRYRSQRTLFRSPSLDTRERHTKERRDRRAEKYASYQQPLERLWALWVSLGRKPDPTEVEDYPTLMEGFSSFSKALHFIEERKDPEDLARSAKTRRADLSVYFALHHFERRKPYKHLDDRLQRDIKAFFGDYATAQQAARALLFQIADVEAIDRACQEAAAHGLSVLEPHQSLQIHVSLIEQLPALLRVYVGCTAALYGDYRNADLVKIHIRSGKISLMKYDHFAENPLPRMVERVKIKLREQDIDYYAYGDEYEPPFLYRKSRYINEEFPNYPEQLAFEDALESLGLFDFSGYGPSPSEFLETLSKNRFVVAGFRLERSQTLPDLDEPCGRYFRFRHLIECGETQARLSLPNRPKQPASYTALLDLAVQILDPVIDYFGMIRLTYGCCSSELAKKIPGRIDPPRDQHASHEVNRDGKRICERAGAAVDFIVDDESMLEVAQWVVVNTPFDRLYFYGDDQPIHVSFGPNNDRQIIHMVPGKSGRRLPRAIGTEAFLSLK